MCTKQLWDFHKAFLRGFYHYGFFLASHPAWFLTIPIGLCSFFAIGFVKYDPIKDIETLYAPINSRALKDRQAVSDTFPDLSATNYNPFSANKLMTQAVVIFKSKAENSALSAEVIQELLTFKEAITSLRVQRDGKNFTFKEICTKKTYAGPECIISGDLLFSPAFREALEAGNVTYPLWLFERQGVDVSSFLGNVILKHNAFLQSAGAVKFLFPLREDTPEMKKMSMAWELEFLNFMSKAEYSTVEFTYSVSQSLNLELDKGTKGDIVFFSITFTLMITYASVVSSGGDCVSTRALLASAGVVAAGVGIMGAFGLITYFGVRFVNIVGVMPFLTLGIGVDDMFLLMGAWSEITAIKDLSVEERIGLVFKKVGVGITITSVTDFIAFAVGASSTFVSVKNFCIYTGAGVILCYICNASFFGACLTYHGRRVYSSRHTYTCKKVERSRAQMISDGDGYLNAYLCGGTIPQGPDDDQSVCEKAPKYILPHLILWKPVRYIILAVFACYLVVAIWGCTTLEQGLQLKDLVLDSSYFHKYQVWDTENFGTKLPVSFVTTQLKDYSNPNTLIAYRDLLTDAKKDPLVNKHVDFCWLTAFSQTPLYNSSNEESFYHGLKQFLTYRPDFKNDIVFDSNSTSSIVASRCEILSTKIVHSNEQANVMTRMRELADASPAGVFAYHPAFIYFEQYLTILYTTLEAVGVTLVVMLVITAIFIPQPMIVAIVMVQIIMIVTGIFGFMAHWGLTLSSVTMIHLIMSVGFSVDFCAHVCTAYIVSEKQTREERAKDAIVRASSPIFNGGISSILGVAILLFTKSYIFQSFFKIMFLVIGFGLLHAVFLIPVVLYYIGPETYVDLEDERLDRPEQPVAASSKHTPSVTKSHSQASTTKTH